MKNVEYVTSKWKQEMGGMGRVLQLKYHRHGNVEGWFGIGSSFKEESDAWDFASIGSLFWASVISLKSILGS